MENPTRNLLISIILVIPLFSRLSLTTFVSIDCGNLESDITDPQTNITWTSDNDDDYIIQEGNSHNVSLGIGALRTLRAFPTLKNKNKKKKKHCYSIGVEDGEKVLTRASFFYGNYDNLSSPPTFDLMFDGNYWASVNTSTSNDQVLDYEVVYVTKGNHTDICVAHHDDESKNNSSNNNIPFISSIELRSLNPSMYNNVDPNYALILLSRRAFGANQDLRYPDDMFDRIWRSKNSGNDLIYAVKSNAFDINTSTVQDQPPQAAMQNAFTVPNTSCQFQYEISSLLPPTNTNSNDDDDTISLYINTYFSEVKNNTFGKRSIRIHKGNISAFSIGPIFPPFGSVEEVHLNMQISSSSSLYFQATHGSALPVIVNAVEVYTIQPLADGTDTRDVEGLKNLQLAFNQTLMEWKGDPCLPIPYSWEWIKCTNDDSKPRVKELNLSGYNLHGVLPDFRSMDALEIIDLHNNFIEGSIPEFLGFFPLLRVLNLSYNRFNGSIPTSLNNTDIAIDIRNNTDLVQMHFQQYINNNSTTSVNDAPKMMISLKSIVLMFQAAIQILYYLCNG